MINLILLSFFFSSRRRHTRSLCDWSSDVCSSDLHRVSADGLPPARTALIERRGGTEAWRLDEAELVVLLGSGGGEPEEVAELAREAGAAFGASREVCASAGVPWSYRVGVYGRPVAPRVLIALDVPDDFEHVTGFVKADVVVALPRAAWQADVQVSAEPDSLRELVNR